jgi:hypothetical protein
MADPAGPGGPAPAATIYSGALGELDQIDQAVYRAVAATPSPSLDLVLSRLSSAADHSKLWLVMAAGLALTPGRPRRAALVGVASIGLASATAVGDELPLAWLPLHTMAAAVTVRYTGRALARRSAGPSQPGGPTMSGSAGTVLSANIKRERGPKRR